MKKIRFGVKKVSPHFCCEIISVIEYFRTFAPFLCATFSAFYHSPSLSRYSPIKNKDGHQKGINRVNDCVARKVST